MRKLYYLAAGLAAVALVAALAASTRLGSDCKTAWGNQACPPAKPAAVQAAKTPPTPPKSPPNLQKTKSAAPKPAVSRKTAKPKRPAAARRPAAVGSLGPRPYAGAPTRREYRDRFERYAAQDPDYRRYGDAPDKDDRARENAARGAAPDSHAVRTPATFDDRARLDPWHGYDDRDGLENRY